MEICIVGLPLSGKTTLFFALTGAHPSRDAAPLARVNLGVAKVADPRLAALAAIVSPQRIVPAEVRFVDLPGAPPTQPTAHGIGGESLNALQRSDALLLVVRAFDDPTVPHVDQSVDPYRDTATMELELAFSDLAILERRVKRLQAELKAAKPQDRDRIHREFALLERLRDGLQRDVPVRAQDLSPEERHALSGYQLLTAKPLLILFNVGEGQLPGLPALEQELAARFARPGVRAAALCARLEHELGQMEPQEQEEFRHALGAGEPGAAKTVRLSYDLLGLITFFTTASAELKAWPIPQGTPALKAAGRIHSDMERGFIRAEVISLDDLERCGGLAEARRRGFLRSEGRDYPVHDADVITFLFNV
ncbi:MAG: redox-regulated ATPase YchF [Chloroflexi bacterium]|nr:redox-regulated ATPase YchF [Chloroflexota bacterium]